MQQRPRPTIIIARSLLLCAAMLVAGCAAISPPPERADVEERVPGDPRQAYDQGNYSEAARLWQQEAIDADAATASRLRLQAADAWLLAGDVDAAEDLLPWIEDEWLSAPDLALLNLVRAEIALDRARPVEARQSLGRVGSALAASYAARYRGLSDRVEAALGSISAASVQQASEMASQIRAYDAEAALALLRQLERVPSRQLAYLAGLKGDPRRAAWFDLALVIRQNLVDPTNLEHEVRTWEARHADFNVSTDDALDLWLRYRPAFRPPASVAVLLPDSGGLRAAGAAIRDGVMSAYLDHPAGSKIQFYGTSEGPGSVLAAYFQAADDGADWIIGPLDRASVEALLNLAGLATPVLALNELPNVGPDMGLVGGLDGRPDGGRLPQGMARQVFGMSLSQEREAAATARRMAELGYTHAVVLAPESTWGERIVQAFQAEFLQKDRNILTAARYLPGENDHSQVLERVLQIDESKARKQQLENRLGFELEFEPVRRSDVDAIFLAAGPEQGRQLAPQLRFFQAGDIPTFATSGVYAGRPDAARNRDLDGLNVPLTTWQVDHPTTESVPALESLRGGEFAPLFAIGMDAWNILPWLDLMRSDPDFRFAGQSGSYSLTQGGNLEREPRWSRFSGGSPRAVAEPSAATDLTAEGR